MTAAITNEVTISVELTQAEHRAWFSRHRTLGRYVVVRRRNGVMHQVFTSSNDRNALCADAQACAGTWGARYVVRLTP